MGQPPYIVPSGLGVFCVDCQPVVETTGYITSPLPGWGCCPCARFLSSKHIMRHPYRGGAAANVRGFARNAKNNTKSLIFLLLAENLVGKQHW